MVWINGDVQVYRSQTCTPQDMENADAGNVRIIRTKDMKAYKRGEWKKIKEWGDD